jgi:4-hydroxythreonine-4-phosphate dehydrogenase
MKPLGITMGDSSGVGPEIVLKAFRQGELPQSLVVVGDMAIMEACNRLLRYDVPLRCAKDAADLQTGLLNVIDLGLMKETDLRIGELSKLSGAAALQYVERATQLALRNEISAIVTLPINKEATRLSSPEFCGHTEFIAELCGEHDSCMMLVSEKLIVTHVSTHVSLRQAIERVTRDRVLRVIRLTAEALRRLRPEQRIAVAGLNPHAGENGAFGQEEAKEIEPAVSEARKSGIDASGPFPPDTLFMQAVKGRFDGVVCMYHDQGHIPLKLLDFEGGINVTLGLPIIRTSVDHGTAFDIAYRGRLLPEASGMPAHWQ